MVNTGIESFLLSSFPRKLFAVLTFYILLHILLISLGVFMMVAFGIIAGVFIISIEIAYKRHRRLKEKELELAKTAADRWRGNIEVTRSEA